MVESGASARRRPAVVGAVVAKPVLPRRSSGEIVAEGLDVDGRDEETWRFTGIGDAAGDFAPEQRVDLAEVRAELRRDRNLPTSV